MLLRGHGESIWVHGPLVEDPTIDRAALMAHAGVRSFPAELAHAGIGGSVAGLCIDVARAWRIERGLALDDARLEALLSDLTACYLGFGLQVLRPPIRQREVRGFLLQTKAPTALDTEALAFVVGAQLVARDPSERQLQRILDGLPTDRLRMVLEAMSWFRTDGKASLDGLLADLDAAGQIVEIKQGRPIHRRASRRTLAGALIGAGFGTAVGLVGLAVSGGAGGFAWALVGAVVGALGGRALKAWRCSQCKSPVGDADVLCPGCGGLVMK